MTVAIIVISAGAVAKFATAAAFIILSLNMLSKILGIRNGTHQR